MKNKLLLLAMGFMLSTQTLMAQVPSYVPTQGLVGYWPFNGNANDDSLNGNNGTVNGATLTTDRFGSVNSAYNFASTNNNYITINNTVGNFGTSDFTISVWYLSTNQNSSHLLNKRFDQDYGNWWEITKFLFGINENDNNSNYGVINNTQLQLDNTWYNIIVTRSGTSLKYYINGILFQSTTTSIVHNISNSNNLVIGSVITPFSGVLQSHDGKIDDIGIWNRALSQQEITTMYNGVNYSDTCNAVSGSLVNGLVAYYPFCGNANDQSGNGLNGVVNGATLTADRFGNSNSAYHFDGLNDVISANVNLSQNVTVSCWIKSEFTTNEFPTFFDFQLSTTNFHWIFYGQTAYNTQIGSRYVTLDNTSSPIFCDNVNLNGLLLNNWQFVTVIVDSASNKHKLYVNGALTNENTIQGTPQIADLIEFGRTGQSANHETNFYGSIDDIGIWNRALTQQEISQLYYQNQCFTNTTVTDTLVINVGQLSYTNPVAYTNNITIFPNPTSTQVNISFNNITDLTGGNINIINSLGQQVATTPITLSGTSTTMSLDTWGGSGLYFVQILNAQGIVVDVKKIILQ